MTDAEYLFKQDIKEKKAAGRGAFHKKASVKGPRGCRMPSDYLTRKEKNAMNGEVVTWSPKAYYAWEEFKAFPNNIQHDYLKAMCEKYECGVNAVVNGIFGRQAANNLQKYLKVRGWDRAEFGSAAHGSAARTVVAQIREDVERAHSQVDKFNEKWGLTAEASEETDISENEEIAAEKETPEWQQILEEEKRKSAEAAFRRSKEAKEAESEPFYEAVAEFLTEEDPIPLHAKTGLDLASEPGKNSITLKDAFSVKPDILASYIEFVCTPDKLADLSAVAALFGGVDEVSVTIRTVKK